MIYLDLDGVVVDWSGGVCKLLNIDKTDPECQKILRSDNWLQGWKFGTNEDIDRLVGAAGYSFWYNLELLPWAHDLYNLLSEYSNVIFLTSPGKFHAGAHAKLDYIWDHFGNRDYILTKHKYVCASVDSILIDDMQKNMDEWRAHGGICWHWPNQYKLLDDPSLVTKEFENLRKLLDQNFKIETLIQ